MNSTKRSSVIDIYKGIGIMLVMMGHIGFGDTSSYIAHAFHMPMFFFISGFLYKEKTQESVEEWMGHKTVSLLCPYFVFGLINYGIFACVQFLKGQTISLSPIGHLLFVNTTGLASGSLWFLTALYISNILFYGINRVFKRDWIRAGIIVFVSYMGIFAAKYLPFRLPYAMDAGMVGVGLFYAGFLLHKYMEKKVINRLFHLSVIETILGCVVFSILTLLNGEINMRKGLYYNTFLFWLNAIAGSILIYNMAAHLVKLEKKKIPVLSWGLRIMEGIGANSLIYVCMNDLTAAESKYFLKLFFTQKSKLNTIFVHSATLMITIVIINFVIKYTPIVRWLEQMKQINPIGRKNKE